MVEGLGYVEIGEFGSVGGWVEEDVLWFQVVVDNVPSVCMSQSVEYIYDHLFDGGLG